MNPYKVESPTLKKRTRMVAVTENPLEIVNKETGEVTSIIPSVGKKSVRDVTEFIKVYNPAALMNLKPCEMKVLLYIMSVLRFGGEFSFECTECMKRTGMKKSSVYNGIVGLEDRDYIRRDENGKYWINPNIAYRGNRDELL